MKRLVLVLHVALLAVGTPALSRTDDLRAQSVGGPATAAQFRLVRCSAQRDAACLLARLALPPGVALGQTTDGGRPNWYASLSGVGMIGPGQPSVSGASQPDISPVFGAPVLPTSSLGRTALRGTITLAFMAGANADTLVRLPARWRPPMLAMPAFAGVADSLALPPAIRDAIAAGAEPPGVRSLMMLVLALVGGLLTLFVPRFLWLAHRESEEDMARQVAAARALLSTQELEQLRGRAPRESAPRTAEESTKPVAKGAQPT